MARPAKLQPEHEAILVEIVRGDPSATWAQIRAGLRCRTGLDAHEQTLVKALRRRGIRRVRDGQALKVRRSAVAPLRDGYRDAHRRLLPGQTYPGCLTDAEWALVEDLFRREGGRGAPPRVEARLMIDACSYVVRTGCSWRMLPPQFPRWQNVYRAFRRWTQMGKFKQMHERLRAQWRERQGRADAPAPAVLDAQSTRASAQGGPGGFDAGKKVKGRKRHLLVDTLGLLLAVSVTAASVQDRDGAHPVVAAAMQKYPGVKALYVDTAYAGQCAQTVSQ